MLRKIIVITCAPDCGVYRGSEVNWKEKRRKRDDAFSIGWKRTLFFPRVSAIACKQREDGGVNLREVDSSVEKELVPV